MKHLKEIPDEFYDWILKNHPDPDNTLGCSSKIYPVWRLLQKEISVLKSANESLIKTINEGRAISIQKT